MSSLTSPRPHPSIQDEMGEYEETKRDLRPLYTPEYCTLFSQLVSTPSTVRLVSREQMDHDLASASMAMKPSDMGYLTEEQEQTTDRHQDSRIYESNFVR